MGEIADSMIDSEFDYITGEYRFAALRPFANEALTHLGGTTQMEQDRCYTLVALREFKNEKLLIKNIIK